MKILSNNKKAYFDYFIIDKYEAGIELKGTDVQLKNHFVELLVASVLYMV